MGENNLIKLRFQGISVKVESNEISVIDRLSRDFEYFISEIEKADITLELVEGDFMLPESEDMVVTGYNKNCIVYERGDEKIIDYKGVAYSTYNFQNDHGRIFSSDVDRLYELSYLTLLSRVGERLDELGFHRVHAAGLEISNTGCLFLLAEGGGKSTLLLSLLGDDCVKILSDDMPLIRGNVAFAFPSRIGLSEINKDEFPVEHVRKFRRTGYVDKFLLDYSYFRDKVVDSKRIDCIFVCDRSLSQVPVIKKISRISLLKALLRDMVFGLGLPQLIEYFLRNSKRDLFKKFIIFTKRSRAAFKLALSSKSYSFVLSTDISKNKDAVVNFLEEFGK